jgi:hypothetical protein
VSCHLLRQGFVAPTPIQRLALPQVVTRGGKDVLGAAETGSGKTLAYGLPILNYLLKQREKAVEAEGGKDARPFAKARPIMRGHTAFLTFAVAGLHPPKSLGPGAVGPTVPDPWIPTSGPPAPAPDPVDELAAEA